MNLQKGLSSQLLSPLIYRSHLQFVMGSLRARCGDQHHLNVVVGFSFIIIIFFVFWPLGFEFISGFAPRGTELCLGNVSSISPAPSSCWGDSGLKAQTAAHPGGRAAWLPLNCLQVPVCDMKHAVKPIDSRCSCKFPSLLPAT